MTHSFFYKRAQFYINFISYNKNVKQLYVKFKRCARFVNHQVILDNPLRSLYKITRMHLKRWLKNVAFMKKLKSTLNPAPGLSTRECRGFSKKKKPKPISALMAITRPAMAKNLA